MFIHIDVNTYSRLPAISKNTRAMLVDLMEDCHFGAAHAANEHGLNFFAEVIFTSRTMKRPNRHQLRSALLSW